MRHTALPALLLLILSAAPVLAVNRADLVDRALEEAHAHIEAGEAAAGLHLIGEVLADDPANPDALNLLGFAKRRAGDLEGAAVAYEAALAIRPDHRGALEYQGELFVMQGETAMAEANLQRLAELCGTCPEHATLAAAIEDGEGW